LSINETYQPAAIEEKLYSLWEEKGFFKPALDSKNNLTA